jgi:hypothetical protein
MIRNWIKKSSNECSGLGKPWENCPCVTLKTLTDSEPAMKKLPFTHPVNTLTNSRTQCHDHVTGGCYTQSKRARPRKCKLEQHHTIVEWHGHIQHTCSNLWCNGDQTTNSNHPDRRLGTFKVRRSTGGRADKRDHDEKLYHGSETNRKQEQIQENKGGRTTSHEISTGGKDMASYFLLCTTKVRMVNGGACTHTSHTWLFNIARYNKGSA